MSKEAEKVLKDTAKRLERARALRTPPMTYKAKRRDFTRPTLKSKLLHHLKGGAFCLALLTLASLAN